MRLSLSWLLPWCLLPLSACHPPSATHNTKPTLTKPLSAREQAQRYLAEGKPQEAESAAKEGLSQQPNDPVLYVTLGMALLSQEKFVEAQAAFAEAVRLSPKDPQPMLLLATTLEQQGNWEDAGELYLEVLQRFPGHPTASMGLAQIFLSLGAMQEAVTALESIRWKEEPKANYFAALGSAYFAAGRSAEAEAALSKAWQLDPTRLDYFSRLCQIWLDIGALDILQQELSAVLATHPHEPSLLLLSAQTLFLQKRYGEALTQSQQVLAASPDQVDALALQGKIYLAQEQYEDAITVLTQAALLAPRKLELMLDRGLAYEGAKQPNDAELCYETAKLLTKDDPRPWLALAQLWQKEQPDKALQNLDDLLLFDPTQHEALLLRAEILLNTGRYTDAISTYEEALRAHPTSARVNNNFAWALVYEAVETQKDCRRGLELALSAVALSKAKSPIELDTLAEAYRCVGDFDNALQTIDKAIENGGSDASYQKHRTEIVEAAKQAKPKKKAR